MIEIKKKHKLFLILLGGVFFFISLILLLISSSFFQNKIILQLSQKFTENTNQKVLIEKINLNWDGSIEFRNFYLGDHHNDTLIYISKLNTSLKNLKNIIKKLIQKQELKSYIMLLDIMLKKLIVIGTI